MRALSSLSSSLSSCLCVLGLVACQSTYAPYEIQLVDGQGGNPVRGVTGSLTVSVYQTGATPQSTTSPIMDGLFQIDVPIGSYEAITAISAEINRTGGTRLIGATIPFVPFNYGYIRVVMGEPGQCVSLSEPRLGGARISPGIAVVEASGISIGGAVLGSPVAAVDVFSPVQLTADATAGTFAMLSEGFGITRLVPFGDASTDLFALDESHAIRYDANGDPATTNRERAVVLHAGAGPRSALTTTLGSSVPSGVAVVGGLDGDRPVTDIRIVPRADGATSSFVLMHPRAGASAVQMGDGLLVAGGQADGLPMFEWVSLTGTRSSVFGDTVGRADGVLALSRDGRTALYYLGRTSDGALPVTSYVISGCPSACVAVPGPVTALGRTSPAVTQREVATVVVGGADLDGAATNVVEEVRFPAPGTVTLSVLGTLAQARRDTAAITLGGGTILVAGGRGTEDVLDTMELCFPEALETITVPSR